MPRGCGGPREWLLDRCWAVRAWWRLLAWRCWRALAALEAIAENLHGLKNEVRLLRQQVAYGRTENPAATSWEKFEALDPEWAARRRAAVAKAPCAAGGEERGDAEGATG